MALGGSRPRPASSVVLLTCLRITEALLYFHTVTIGKKSTSANTHMVTYEYQRRADFLHIHMRCAGKCRQVTRMECPIESSQCLNSGAVQLRLQTLQLVYYLALKPATPRSSCGTGSAETAATIAS